MKTYVTFGQIHTHSVNGKTFDKDCVAVIEAPDAESGRALAFDIFNRQFGTSYDETQWDAEKLKYFPRGLIYIEEPITTKPIFKDQTMTTIENCINTIPDTHRILIRNRSPRDDWPHDAQWFVHLIPVNAVPMVRRDESHPNGLSEPSAKGYGPDLVSAFRQAIINIMIKGH